MSFGTELIKQLDTYITKPMRHRLSKPYDTAEGARARIAYVLSPKTGASVATVAALARVSPSTVYGWSKGRTPGAEFRGQIDDVYQRFSVINQRAKTETTRQKAAREVLASVQKKALRVTNTEGDFRYWKPTLGARAATWFRFVARWARSNAAGLNQDWNKIIESWDYPEPWDADLIEEVEIV